MVGWQALVPSSNFSKIWTATKCYISMLKIFYLFYLLFPCLVFTKSQVLNSRVSRSSDPLIQKAYSIKVTLTAKARQTAPIFRSRERTPASRVYLETVGKWTTVTWNKGNRYNKKTTKERWCQTTSQHNLSDNCIHCCGICRYSLTDFTSFSWNIKCSGAKPCSYVVLKERFRLIGEDVGVSQVPSHSHNSIDIES